MKPLPEQLRATLSLLDLDGFGAAGKDFTKFNFNPNLDVPATENAATEHLRNNVLKRKTRTGRWPWLVLSSKPHRRTRSPRKIVQRLLFCIISVS